MAKFPRYLEPYRKQAEVILSKGDVRDIEFSGSTYQIQVFDDKNQEAWAFIQLDPKGNIKDSFCSCDTDQNGSSCVHVAAAYLKILNRKTVPLHVRFQRSLWNQLCELYAEQLGTSTESIAHTETTKKLSEFSCNSPNGEKTFAALTNNKTIEAKLEQILQHRRKETEETSLKFSNLTQEEIALWREGRPNRHLRYELSYWNDLAKWLMLLQDSGTQYTINFSYSDEGIPNQIQVQFPDLELLFVVSKEELIEIIPSLATVQSPLRVHSNYEESISKILFDQEEGALKIIPITAEHVETGSGVSKNPTAINLEKWLLIPNDGFYAKDQHSLLDHPIMHGKEINQALHEHPKEIQHLLQGAKFHEDPVKIAYDVTFDNEWNMHIASYLLEHGDLLKPYSHLYGDWAYLQDDGFYKIEEVYFDQGEVVIPTDKVNDFVTQNRGWLNFQEGFHTHLINIENQLTYTVDQYDRLKFETKIDISEESEDHRDFGTWIYIKDQGFFSKISSNQTLPLHTGISIDSEAIPLFIKMNRDELMAVPGFFCSQNPVLRAALKVELDDQEMIHITPEYQLLPEYSGIELKFFKNVVYLPGEGFYELPLEVLPDQYLHPVQIEKGDTDYFFEHEFPLIKKYVLPMDPQLSQPEKLELVAESIEEESKLGRGWDLMKMSYQSEFGKVNAAQIWKGFHDEHRFLRTPAGLLDLKDDRFNWVKHLKKNRIDLKRNLMTLNAMEILRLDAFDEIHPPTDNSKYSQHTRQLLKELKDFTPPDKPDLEGLTSHLRPYQEVGVSWLWFLYHHGLSGLLCDDMGLGKTHQAMALLAAVNNLYKQTNPDKTCHFLVICPTSVIFHWQEKLQRFLPQARICTFHGIKRSLGDFQKEYDILLTSYGIWRNDNELLNKVTFEVAVFDEIQVAKNYSSQIYASLLKVRSKMRVGLTGTPIENRLRELKALFDIALPHYMPDETEYREFFVKPIEKFHDDKRRLLLSKFIKPFVTRRKKEEVLSDLPEKTEEISHCVLLPQQKALYQQVLQHSRDRILSELSDDKNPIPYMHIFALLSALKQICNHPAAYLKQPEEYKKFQSGKWELFLELLSEARESQQKVVVFSHYLNMLDIIQSYLKEHGIGYAAIRGSTANRGEEVRRFNNDPKCEVFVGSLHAAGLGIDLTAGSVVIHYDRWWNAARENQATDRVHRIGQTRGVQVFKLVTKWTFEERIDALIAQKGRLMEEVVGTDDQQVIKQFDRHEIIQLLQDVDTSSKESKDSMDSGERIE